MKQLKKMLPILLILAGLALMVVGCQAETIVETVQVEVTRIVEQRVEVPVTQVVEVIITPEPGQEVPYEALWATSAHAAVDSVAFRRWDGADPKVVPENCAKCHSPEGYLDFLGADGSDAGVVNAAHAPTDVGITCVACHNPVTAEKTSVVMPSGIEIMGLGDESRCMECHQGRASKVQVDAAIGEAGEDDVIDGARFINIHYYAAAATKYGADAKGGYEYEGKSYDTNFAHVEAFDTCISCHDPHTLEVKVETCETCHPGVQSAEDFKDVRMVSSAVDYDGDGDITEGVYYEIMGLKEILGAELTAAGLVYNPDRHPYFFDDAEQAFAAWTPRLLKAAYNYQVASKDPGAHAHNGKYIIQLLYDSIETLNPTAAASLNRIDHGHFAGSETAFRYWDAAGVVPSNCAKCHTSTGLPTFLAEGVNIREKVTNGLECSTCHNEAEWPALYTINSVTFPSGKVLNAENADPNTLMCMNCHMGRSSSTTVNRLLAGKDLDTVDATIRFQNIHFFAAAATLYGSEVEGAFQYADQEYVGKYEHGGIGPQGCTDCHSAHALEVEIASCSTCHRGVSSIDDLYGIRISEVDYDGDGDVAEGIKGEITTLAELLYVAIQDYAGTVGAGTPVYNPARHPYWFNEEGTAYAEFTPRLLKAAYNYQYAKKDPGAFAHNPYYVIQALYDSIADMGGDVSGLTRP